MKSITDNQTRRAKKHTQIKSREEPGYEGFCKRERQPRELGKNNTTKKEVNSRLDHRKVNESLVKRKETNRSNHESDWGLTKKITQSMDAKL